MYTHIDVYIYIYIYTRMFLLKTAAGAVGLQLEGLRAGVLA